MSWFLSKSWDNRKTCNRSDCTNSRTWTRRIQYLTDNNLIKLKLEVRTNSVDEYREVVCNNTVDANTIWLRFREGQSINDSISILAQDAPKYLKSKKAK